MVLIIATEAASCGLALTQNKNKKWLVLSRAVDLLRQHAKELMRVKKINTHKFT